jgi:hypothetical protein
MIRSLFVLALLLAAPLAGQVSAGMQMRVDESTSAADPDDVPDVTITPVANGFQVRTGPAAVLFDPANTATGNYTLKGTFRLNEVSSHPNYYGLVLGGRDLQGANQNYLYFLVAQNGAYLIKHRMGEMIHDLVPSNTRHAAVAAMGRGAPASTNALEVRVGAANVDFVINGQVVNSTPRTSLAGATDGIWGVRVNHVIPSVTVEGLGVTRQ